MNPAIDAIVTRHTRELDAAAASGEISKMDRMFIGIIMGTSLSALVTMSDNAWQLTQRIVTESRTLWQGLEEKK